ncbi:amidase family protein [Streptomyces sp. DSM 40750]|uniref:amidase family protein n=1 Tax=Streptomyces sp. DSM 40750 TaxID=2801030 RepID=UPI003FA7DBA8
MAGATGVAGATRATRAPGITGAAGTTKPTGDAPPPVTAVWSADLGFADTDPEPAAIAHSAALRLADTGLVRLAGLVRPPVRQEKAPVPQENPPHPPVERTNPPRLEDPGPGWLALRSAPDTDPATLRAAQELRAENDRRLAALFAGADLLLTPTTPNAPHGHEGPGERYSTALTWAFNLSGHPAMSIPAGFDSDGCPVGLQLVARHGEEDLLLRVARAAEAAEAARAYPHREHRAYPDREQETSA